MINKTGPGIGHCEEPDNTHSRVGVSPSTTTNCFTCQKYMYVLMYKSFESIHQRMMRNYIKSLSKVEKLVQISAFSQDVDAGHVKLKAEQLLWTYQE